MWWCDMYGDFLFTLGAALLLVSAVAAAVETFIVTQTRIQAARQAQSGAQSVRTMVADGIDPVKFLEALKGFLQALKDLPTWIALFGAGVALVFVAGVKPGVCP